MVGVNICDGPVVEHLLVNDVKIRAVSFEKHVFRHFGVSTVEVHFHLDVVENAKGIVHGVITHGLNGHLAKPDATHDSFHADNSFGFTAKTAGLISRLIHDERHVFGSFVLAKRRLTRHQGVHAVVSQTVVGAAEAGDFDTGFCTEWNGNQLVDDGNLGISLVAADDGVRQAEPREGPAVAFIVLSF